MESLVLLCMWYSPSNTCLPFSSVGSQKNMIKLTKSNCFALVPQIFQRLFSFVSTDALCLRSHRFSRGHLGYQPQPSSHSWTRPPPAPVQCRTGSSNDLVTVPWDFCLGNAPSSSASGKRRGGLDSRVLASRSCGGLLFEFFCETSGMI